jgi:hypothetical protein
MNFTFKGKDMAVAFGPVQIVYTYWRIFISPLIECSSKKGKTGNTKKILKRTLFLPYAA